MGNAITAASQLQANLTQHISRAISWADTATLRQRTSSSSKRAATMPLKKITESKGAIKGGTHTNTTKNHSHPNIQQAFLSSLIIDSLTSSSSVVIIVKLPRYLEALSVYDLRTRLVVLLLRDPHLLERGQRHQKGSLRQHRLVRWYHHVRGYRCPYGEGNQGPRSSIHEAQDRCSS